MARIRCRWRACMLCLCTPCLCVLLLFLYTAAMMSVAMKKHVAGETPLGSSMDDYMVPPEIKAPPDPNDRFIAGGAVKTKKYSATPKVFWDKNKQVALWNQLQKEVDAQLNPILRPGAPQTAPEASLLSHSLSELRGFRHSSLTQQLLLYVSSMSRRQYPVLLQPEGQCGVGDTQERGSTLLLLAIKTSAQNYRNRQAIRQSWGRGGLVYPQRSGAERRGAYVRRLFLLGTERSPDLRNMTSDLLRLESQHYGDLLQWDMWDSPLNGSMQRLLFWSWFRDSCGHTAFVLEGDDQLFVNTPALVSLLQEQLHTPHLQDFMMGNVVVRGRPQRNSHSQEFIPESFYRGWYPMYARGEGRVSSALLLQRLLQVSDRVHLFPIEQVYVGMCMIRLNLSPTHHPAFLPSEWTKEEQEPCAAHRVLLLHTHSPTHMLQLWERSNTHTGPCANATVLPLTTRGTRLTTEARGHVWGH
ncbi:N-acetyllactosaminide beta-1,3-N-acetylglucosaminyltransferase 2-like [Boleophthalmus pectinirostris]|uniref:N-acetyllactosaminide beta-1,3-N-acetylglucosaminyltransferase 2-like n=1 Tax=Boleophthalmus pectinirostris TaxID=150288 RepID=UPI0024328900|nr:N-acetyllactosaminide beta-1,3-N-acetylglucosaminyltransferase 2-like [Boleophthalmus pectinirostris]